MNADQMAKAATDAGHTPESFFEFLSGTAKTTKLRKLEEEKASLENKMKSIVNDATLDVRNRITDINNEIDSIKQEISGVSTGK